jgi:hypothetical protein
MKRQVDVLYGLKGTPNTSRFTAFKTDLFANGSTPAITVDTASTNGVSVTAATTTAIRNTGACTTGLLLSGTATNQISITGAATNGISIAPTAATTCAILIGTSISAGMVMTSTKNGLIRAFGEVATTAALSNDIRGGWFRVRQNADVDLTGGYSVVGVQGSAKMYGGSGTTATTLWCHSGVHGIFESDGVSAATVLSTGRVSGVMGTLGLAANFTIASGAVAAALIAFSTTASATTATGSYAGLYVAVDTGAKAFTNAIEIATSAAATGVKIGTCTTGVDLAGTHTTAINITAAANVTNLFAFNAVAGCVRSVDVNPADDPSDGGLGADGCLKIDIGGLDYFIPIFATELS